MVIYVAHEYGGKADNYRHANAVIKNLQKNDLENTYICPIQTFSYLGYKEIGYDEEMALCEDLLMLCDKLLVASNISDGVEREIKLAELCKIPIEYLEGE